MASIASLLNPSPTADQQGFYHQETFRTHEQLMMTYGVNLKEDGRIKSMEQPLPNLATLSYADLNGLQTPELLPFQKKVVEVPSKPVIKNPVRLEEDDADTEPDSDQEETKYQTSPPKSKKPQNWEAWRKTYDELVQYLQINLFWPPSKGETLGKWCTTQRTLWRREQLDEERYKLLNDIGFIWHPPNVTYDRLFDLFYNDFKQLQRKAGNIGVWCEDEKMNWWISGQRYLRKIDKIPEDRVALLDELGFIWNTTDKPSKPKVKPTATKPEKKRKKEPEEEYLSAPSTPETKLFDSDQRVTRRREKTVFNDYVDSSMIYPEYERIPKKKSKASPPSTRNSSPLMMIKEEACLEPTSDIIMEEEVRAPSPTVKPEKDDIVTWMQNYNLYVQFWHDNLFYPATDSPLGKWACRQRTLKRRDQIASDRKELLDKFGFLWDQPHARQCNNWIVLYKEAELFKKEHGHLNVPMNTTLNWWMALQRAYKKSNKLPAERIKDLDMLDFEWSPKPKSNQTKLKKSVDDSREQIVPSMKNEVSSKMNHFLRAVTLDSTDV